LHEIAGRSVLVVDDDAASRELLSSMLQACGARVTTVDTGEAALRLIMQQRPDVLVADLAMPQMNGIDRIQRVRALRRDQGGAGLRGGPSPPSRSRHSLRLPIGCWHCRPDLTAMSPSPWKRWCWRRSWRRPCSSDEVPAITVGRSVAQAHPNLPDAAVDCGGV